MKQILRLLLIGISSSLVLGALLKWIQISTGKRTYLLLLNVDYLPIIKDIQMGEFFQFLLHVFVSVLIVFVLYFGLKQLGRHSNIKYYMAISAFIGVVLYLTTSFSERTPELLDTVTFIYWVFGHIIYGITVGLFIKMTEQ